MRICKVKNCEVKNYSNGYCSKHYAQKRTHGKILKRTIFDKNEIICKGNICEIVLYKGRSTPMETARAIINNDKKILNKIKKYKWHLGNHGYAIYNNNKILLLHHLILPKRSKLTVDHIDTNKLNNCKSNLRYATKTENLRNRKAKGYCWNKKDKRWQPYIRVKYKQINLGSFINEEDAIKARKQAEIKYFKEFRYKG